MTGDALWIESTRSGPEGEEPMCRITWGAAAWYATVGDVRATALDLVTCAAYAEMMMSMHARLELATRVALAFTADLLRSAHPGKAEQGALGLPSTILVMPSGSTSTGAAGVLLRRDQPGSPDVGALPFRLRGSVPAGEARRMAARWFMVAEASEQDRLIPEALPDAWHPDAAEALGAEHLAELLDMDLLFAKLRLLRDRKGDLA